MEVKSSDSGKVDCSLSDVEGFPGKDQELNDFFYNMKEDYVANLLSQRILFDQSNNSGLVQQSNLTQIKYVNETIKNRTNYNFEGTVSVEMYTINKDKFYYKMSSIFLNNKNINEPLFSIDYLNNKKEISLFNYKRMKTQSFLNTSSIHDLKMCCLKNELNKWPSSNIRNSYNYYNDKSPYNNIFNVKLIDFLNKNFKKSIVDYRRNTYFEIGKKDSLRNIEFKPLFNDNGGFRS